MYYSEWIIQHSVLLTLNNIECCVIRVIQSEYVTWCAIVCPHIHNEIWLCSRTFVYIYTYIYIYICIYRGKIICESQKEYKLINLWNPEEIIWNVSTFHIFIIIYFLYISYFHISYESILSFDYFDLRSWWCFIVYNLLVVYKWKRLSLSLYIYIYIYIYI